MTDDKVQAIAALVARALDLPEEEIGPDSSMWNTPAWDSTEHLNICLAVEQRFGTRFDMDAIANATSVRALAELIP